MAESFHGYQSLVENSTDAISLINQQGQILYGSASNKTLFGYGPEELVGRNCIDLLHPEDRHQSSQLLNQVIVQPSGPRHCDVRVRRKDGTYRWVESTLSNLTADLEVRALVIQQRDIHERREAHENSLRQAEELTRSNQRMEEFAYTVAHDLREPLRAISVYTQILFSSVHVQMDDQAKEMAQFVMSGANRMSVMISDLLDFARTGMAAPPVMLNLESTVSQVLQNLALEIQESAAVITMGPLPTVYSDEVHLLRVFQNLISNAIKYRSKQPPKIHISARVNGNGWIIKVKDTGLGISGEYLSKIFMPFVRLENHNVTGTGLGLAVCKKAIESLGGTIWVESEPGAGSTFLFTIPGASHSTNHSTTDNH